MGVVVAAVIVRGLFRRGGGRRGDLMAPPSLVPRRLDAGLVVAPSPGAEPFDEAALREAALRLVRAGNAINAIKLVRDQTGLGLKEAKDYVDALRQDDTSFR